MIGRVRKPAAGALILGLVAGAPLPGQDPPPAVTAPPAVSSICADSSEVIDRILAVVGSRAILKSQVQEQIFVAFPGCRGFPEAAPDQARLRRQVVDRLVDDELLVQEAERDTAIKVLPEEVTQSVDELMRNARARYRSEDEYRRDLAITGFQSPDEYRSWLSEQQRRTLMINRLKEKLQGTGQLKPVTPTEAEMRRFFDDNKGRLGQRPATIAFRQLVVGPRPSQAAKERARAQADSIAAELRKGGDFASAARRFSMDIASRDRGGSIDWVRRGEGLDPRFEEMAFGMRPGVISNPVETSFGYHLIQVERAQPAEVSVRHILIMPAVDSVEADSARRAAENILAALKAGANFDSLARLWHDPAEEREAQPIPVDRIPPIYIQAIGDATTNDLVGPFRLDAPGDPLRSKHAILVITSRTAAGDVRYEDVKEQIRAQLGRDLTDRRYLDRLRRGTYVDIRLAE